MHSKASWVKPDMDILTSRGRGMARAELETVHDSISEGESTDRKLPIKGAVRKKWQES